ncbi:MULTISPECIES: 1-deoxy-D-xylulose-5-phosphate synthase [Marinobacter]|jgi:1-deoxy-D-xylulose-5-phosphate synthase|uniref:1-deoxy-D-xylulose-5-phosphate synthase n=1 Tax=Marinobacter shengliensis TaxID=1389223 RepID=A0ABV4W962_9GAMM|nr:MULTISPECIES: 1-deoxy-D-xylulose-5-phosphate synthase [Marinobacter]MAO13957.1 1-deoxy-D-xylulose-5-phosphate synthase [Marinobacter sp.]MCD1630122.1 1-deoxy-D-xylulose-5-phosphate synthase [Marinobacter shengliensis]WBU42108.1 1-deoxy-D-xylulose-5-phosphate synthase [Marinobacter alkaliphilus]BEH13542.1 1-deoxy-D-xylulose-5-phosphate synthase [Marinobacter shengliensis]
MQDTYIFREIPSQRPNTPILDRIDVPAQLRTLPEEDLPQLARELRAFLLWSVGQTGGHFGAGLGVLELTVALHYVFNTPEDRLVWDVGHQAYPHKILTGRREQMGSIRRKDGLAGFPKRAESEYDTFGVGHSSTSISAALGMAIAARMQNTGRKSIAVIGDGAMTAGMAFEALNHAGHLHADMLVILNDNDMSISRNVGGLSNYFAKLLASRTYNQVRDSSKKVLKSTPHLMALAKKTEEHFKGMIAPGTLFEELGFNYIGPIDGHDLPLLVETLENIRELDGPQFLHVVTTKGKGFAPAEADPIGYHAINKIEPVPPSKPEPVKPKQAKPKYANVFGQWLCDAAEQDERVVGITPAMCEGSDLLAFSERYPDRYFDVAIAEQHAVTLAAGLACDGAKPVVAIYSTFLQRGYDQLIHDVAIQDLDVLFAIDRAGLVGEDGPTHAGAFDISYLRCIPKMVVMTPSDENETRQLLHTGLQYHGPAAVRYPRGTGPGAEIQQALSALPLGKGRVVREGARVAILNFGTLLGSALEAADSLNATVADMRFVKPLDESLVLELAEQHDLLVTLEENVVAGGAGSAVTECLNKREVMLPVLQLGLPDRFVDHGKHGELLKECGLDPEGIRSAIASRIDRLGNAALTAIK